MFNHPYICLSTKQNLNDEHLKSWFGSIIERGPSGIIASAELHPDNKQQRFYRRKTKDTNHYVVVLGRDINTDEATKIAEQINSTIKEGDFEITWSQKLESSNKHKTVSEDMLKAIALEAVKLNHNNWLRKRTNEGWRFGQKHDKNNKTSPMCKEWDGLSESYKKIEYQRMTSLLEVLDKMNLKIIR